jgi:hypothetical protein
MQSPLQHSELVLHDVPTNLQLGALASAGVVGASTIGSTIALSFVVEVGASSTVSLLGSGGRMVGPQPKTTSITSAAQITRTPP